MNELYKIIKLKDSYYDCLVIATGYENPIDYIEEILDIINKEEVKIPFDFTLINGTHDNRYIEYDSSKDKNYFKRFSIVRDLDDDVKETSKKFFMDNEELVNKNVLIPRALKFLLIKGMV